MKIMLGLATSFIFFFNYLFAQPSPKDICILEEMKKKRTSFKSITSANIFFLKKPTKCFNEETANNLVVWITITTLKTLLKFTTKLMIGERASSTKSITQSMLKTWKPSITNSSVTKFWNMEGIIFFWKSRIIFFWLLCTICQQASCFIAIVLQLFHNNKYIKRV